MYDLYEERDGSFIFTPSSLESGAADKVIVMAALERQESRWSDEVELLQKGDGADTSSSRPSASEYDIEKMKEEREDIEKDAV